MTAGADTGFSTRQVHAGAATAPATPRATPIYLTAGFTFSDLDESAEHFGTGAGFGYSRTGNPTVQAVEQRLASLEGGDQAVLVSSGQAAVTVALLALAGAGDHVVVSEHIYEGTRGLLLDNLARLGIETTFVDVSDLDALRAAITPRTKALFAETLSNARNDVLDVAAVAAVGAETGIPLVVDSTFTTPYLLRPIEHGAAVVVHSASKFLAGQGAVLGGVIVDDGRFDAVASGHLFPHLVQTDRLGGASYAEKHGARARGQYIRESVAPRFGPSPSPLNAFLIGQGIETLSLRVERQSTNALVVARWLEERPEVERVDYVGLESHPHHALGERYLRAGHGSVFTLTLRGGLEAARHLVQSVRLITHMTHLGDVRSLVLHPQSTSHSARTVAERERAGVFPGTVRLSIGIEDVDDIIADLEQALVGVPSIERKTVVL
ncbi:O-acetylhomoserine (thiol)-lyase [Microbacterium sp. ru370.1]|uniref:O-acetylhomoserine aminocarboxypropyltransferase/cysteine synthase family protein n=1 Tax=unclassified Microbacterium TaxID=2609290 RepID=UPI0008809D69|nr:MULTISPECIES: PLP-dependent transferase [unclassified Microbacterium]SDO81254.1 O-acetylhomoserine (thiol)-lyase [Microbacterium sp. ru370.1]SIT89770.1 O-acetylhomoserine (thiol)-lyase [Microbacterium sp. RU1D]